jgi:hypothetical protein
MLHTIYIYQINPNNQIDSKTNKLSSISISIKFHQYLMLHTIYIYQINQINQKQTNHRQFQYQSNFIKYLMLHTSYIYQINQINQIDSKNNDFKYKWIKKQKIYLSSVDISSMFQQQFNNFNMTLLNCQMKCCLYHSNTISATLQMLKL